MVRTYDASRRTEAAARTREAIIEAAFRLHGQGVFEFEPLAEEANVSLATVRKHFPNRERLFENCVLFGLHGAPEVDVAAVAAVEDQCERVPAAVERIYAFHEHLLGQMWSAYQLAGESPALAGAVRDVEELVFELAGAVVGPAAEGAGALQGFVSGMLSPLTYRALRLSGGLSPQEAVASATRAVLHELDADASPRTGGDAYR